MNKKQNTFTIHVWDRSVRVFHWINVGCVLGLIAVGLIIFFNKNLGVSAEGKILLKTIHVYIGYVFVLNLIWRLLWSFLGSKYSRYAAFIPFKKGFSKQFKSYVQGLKNKQAESYAGHNPAAKLMVFSLYMLLIIQAITGLVLAGTDLYMPPFGQIISEWVAVTNDAPTVHVIQAGSMDGVDPVQYKAMRDFRSVFITTHVYTFYLLLAMIFLHVVGVVFSELREKNGLVSAMITGEKVFKEKPVDEVDDQSKKG